MKNQAFNPYLPEWEYIPDGEPHVFGERLYIYGSHDSFNGNGYCLLDYACYSCPLNDLSDWRYEGIIYKKSDDPINPDGKLCFYAPDVCQGADGRYYLYYGFDTLNFLSVAVCDTPAGKFEFYGYVHHPDGTPLGEKEGDEKQFDPAVLFENNQAYLYSGFCAPWESSKKGSMCYTLAPDMLTVTSGPYYIAPSSTASDGTGFEGHEFFEASSIRKIREKYYFVYSSVLFHELCYAISDKPTGPFKFGGTVISAGDIGIDSYKDADMPIAQLDNNHGGMVNIGEKWYIFYHRHTNGHCFSRQGCAEEITILPDGSIPQVSVSSCGLNGGALSGIGEYPAAIACRLFSIDNSKSAPRLTMTKNKQYITNIHNKAIIGFSKFDLTNTNAITVLTNGFIGNAFLDVKTEYNGDAICSIGLGSANDFTGFFSKASFPKGVHDLYFCYRGEGSINLSGFILE